MVGKKGHEGTESSRNVWRKWRSFHIVLGAIVEMMRECLDAAPQRIREIIVAIHAPVEMPALPVESKTVRQGFRYPDIHETAIMDEQAEFRTTRLTLDEQVRTRRRQSAESAGEGLRKGGEGGTQLVTFALQVVEGKEVLERLSFVELAR